MLILDLCFVSSGTTERNIFIKSTNLWFLTEPENKIKTDPNVVNIRIIYNKILINENKYE